MRFLGLSVNFLTTLNDEVCIKFIQVLIGRFE